MSRLVTRLAQSDPDLDEVRALCRAYRTFLAGNSAADAQVADIFYPEPAFDALMAALGQEHAPPDGAIWLAELDSAPVACGMSRRIGPDMAEIKRVYVRAEARGDGVGEALFATMIAHLRAAGFARVVLDTSRNLHGARRFYTRLGFVERGPFADVPDAARDLLCYYELTL